MSQRDDDILRMSAEDLFPKVAETLRDGEHMDCVMLLGLHSIQLDGSGTGQGHIMVGAAGARPAYSEAFARYLLLSIRDHMAADPHPCSICDARAARIAAALEALEVHEPGPEAVH